MGLAKQHLIEIEARGYKYIDKAVCNECVDDPFLQAMILANATDGHCDYCGRSVDHAISIPFDNLVAAVLDGVKTEWTDPANQLPYETAQGGYLFKEFIYETDELLTDELEVSHNETLLEDLSNAILTTQWCKDDFFGTTEKEDMQYSWDHFCFTVKHKVRFSFLRFGDNFMSKDSDLIKPSGMLAFVAGLFRAYGTISELSPGDVIYRARRSEPGNPYHQPRDLCPVDWSSSKQPNRMSPAGIPLFYGSDHPDTAGREVCLDKTKPDTVTIGSWRVLKKLVLLDLSAFEKPPSIFDVGRDRGKYMDLGFLQDFVHEISKPISKGANDNIEYVPTQVLTEYLRFVFRSQGNRGLDGILYKSAVSSVGKSLVLFCDRQACVGCSDFPREAADSWLELISSNELLVPAVRSL